MTAHKDRPNLYIGLVCAVGTDLIDIKRQLRAQLSVVGYKSEEIKVSKRIAEALKISVPKDHGQRVADLMDGGDKIRENSVDGDGVASLIVTDIRISRGDNQSTSTCFIIDSLKNPKEDEVLNQIYSRNYYTVGVFSSLEKRRENLANRIATTRHEPIGDSHWDAADTLIARDEKGQGSKGQSVRDTFPRADFFIDTQLDITKQIQRFIELIFGQPFITPTLDEYMMFLAKATALRSCDLSRQVGAVIVGSSGELISTGCNEVPLPGGGFYVEGRTATIPDNRDKVEQHDPNFHEIKRSISELISVMQSAGIILDDKSAAELAEQLIHGEHKELTSEARIRNLIEFGRVVHAEMHAISQAAMLGRSIKGGMLFCTTYPCHICARHIIASGINEVIYIEPYPKSLTASLYHREIVSEGEQSEGSSEIKKVNFRAFRGISPTLYQRVFSYRKRKDTYGGIEEWKPMSSTPVGAVHDAANQDFEIFVANQLEKVLSAIHNARTVTQGEIHNE